MIECHVDFEWFSDVEIRRGPERYFGAARQGPLMLSYAFDGDSAISRWLPSQPCPARIAEHARSGGRFVAHNAGGFERHAWAVLARDHGWPALEIKQWRDTMASALAMGLPADLESLAAVLGLPEQKDKRGKALIKFFCVPRADGGFNDGQAPEHRNAFREFQDYCDQDVRTEMAVDARLIPLSFSEQDVWILDQIINDRGIRVDRPSALAALALIDKAKALADQRMREATGNAVPRCTDVAKLTAWIADQGVQMDGVAKDDLIEALDLEDLPTHVRDVLEIRQAAAKTSTAKIAKLLMFSEGSGRIKHRYRFHGAGPGRWSCLDPNLFNLPRPRALYQNAVEEGEIDINQAFEFIRTGSPELVEAAYGPKLGSPLEFLSDSLRGFLVAAPGHDLLAVDYSSIQGVLTAWFAGEDWKLQAIQEILDDPKKPDLYRRAAAKILNLPLDVVTKKHWGRQIGKVSELALGFAGGCKALVSMSKNYGLRKRQLHDLYPGVWSSASEENREAAVKRYAQVSRSRNREDSDILTREAWLACSLIVRGWRQTNPAIKASWTTLETAVRNAVRNPGQTITTLRGVQYVVKRGYLWCKLPSGRCIAYGAPKLKDQMWARLKLSDGSWGESEVVDGDEARAAARRGEAKIEGETSPKVTALGRDPSSKKMSRYALYGGLCMENCVDRDTLVLTERGWRPIDRVEASDTLWDGEEWVRHWGVVSRGQQQTIEVGGVLITPDHKVLTINGWKKADSAGLYETTAASSYTRPGGRQVWTTNSDLLRGRRRAQKLVELAMRVRTIEAGDWRRIDEGQDQQLRMSALRTCIKTLAHAWYVRASWLLGVAVDDRSMPSTLASSLQKLWRPWNFGVCAMERFFGVLGGYGPDLSSRSLYRTKEQSRELRAWKLRMGYLSSSEPKPPRQSLYRHAEGSDAVVRSSGFDRAISRLSAASSRLQVACQTFIRRARLREKDRIVDVFDILNAGPRHRFTILTNCGPIIISNCALGAESDILRVGMRNCEDGGYPIVLHCYDEAVSEMPHGRGSVDEMAGLMLDFSKRAKWAVELPLGAAGWRGKRYRKG